MKKLLPIIKNSDATYAINNIFYTCMRIPACSDCILNKDKYPCDFFNFPSSQQKLRKKYFEKMMLKFMFRLIEEKY